MLVPLAVCRDGRGVPAVEELFRHDLHAAGHFIQQGPARRTTAVRNVHPYLRDRRRQPRAAEEGRLAEGQAEQA